MPRLLRARGRVRCKHHPHAPPRSGPGGEGRRCPGGRGEHTWKSGAPATGLQSVAGRAAANVISSAVPDTAELTDLLVEPEAVCNRAVARCPRPRCQHSPDQVRPGQTRPAQARLGQVRPGQATPGQPRPVQASPGQTRPAHGTGQASPERPKADRDSLRAAH